MIERLQSLVGILVLDCVTGLQEPAARAAQATSRPDRGRRLRLAGRAGDVQRSVRELAVALEADWPALGLSH